MSRFGLRLLLWLELASCTPDHDLGQIPSEAAVGQGRYVYSVTSNYEPNTLSKTLKKRLLFSALANIIN